MPQICEGINHCHLNTGADHICLSYFACLGEGLPDFAVPPAVAGRDEVGHATALQEGGGGDGAFSAEDPGEADHLHQAEANHGCLGVVAESQAVTEARSHCYDVLQRQVKQKCYCSLYTQELVLIKGCVSA